MIFVEIAWPSDIVFKTVNVVGCHRSVDGNQFEVVQTWNEDFYLLELVHTGPGGDRWRVALDGDCPKVWRCKLSASEDLRLLSVSAKGIVASYNWDRHELIRANGVVVHAYRTSR